MTDDGQLVDLKKTQQYYRKSDDWKRIGGHWTVREKSRSDNFDAMVGFLRDRGCKVFIDDRGVSIYEKVNEQ